jgi:flagellar biosynthesis/type III secretory pathway protein FliH
MPILNDIMDHRVIGPAIRKGIAQGLEQGRRESTEKARQEEAVAILRRQITKRFGTLPASFENRLTESSTAELEDLSERFVDATSITDLFDPA